MRHQLTAGVSEPGEHTHRPREGAARRDEEKEALVLEATDLDWKAIDEAKAGAGPRSGTLDLGKDSQSPLERLSKVTLVAPSVAVVVVVGGVRNNIG